MGYRKILHPIQVLLVFLITCQDSVSLCQARNRVHPYYRGESSLILIPYKCLPFESFFTHSIRVTRNKLTPLIALKMGAS